MSASVRTPVDVAVGVLINRRGEFLLAQRPPGKPMAGYWEFPGGKCEPGESVFDALCREFKEELGLTIKTAYPWAQHIVDYPHALVRLHFMRSFAWEGEPQSLEGQQFCWESIDHVTTHPWLPGALPLKRWLMLPAHYAVSNAQAMGDEAFLAAFEVACAAGLRLVQLREKALDAERFARLFANTLAVARAHGTRVLVNSHHPQKYWDQADGVHLSAKALAQALTRPSCDWCASSVHDANEIATAHRLGCDFAVLGAVASTASHPDGQPLGWPAFASLAAASSIPLYAIGGLTAGDIGDALVAGAQGIAALRGGLSPELARLRWI